MVRITASIIAAALTFAVTTASAQTRVNVRGIVKQVSGNTIVVSQKSGGEAAVILGAKTRIATTAKFSLADIKSGMKLGVTTVVRGKDIVAIDVRPIPKRAPDGLRPYDLAPNSTMTNGILEGKVEGAASGKHIMINYGKGKVKVLVPPGTAMSRAAKGSKADIKPGETFYAAAVKGKDGKLTALRVQVSKNGIKPTQ